MSRLKFVSSGPLRPTASKVREALFNILQSRLEGASFLDLYAGVGAVGIEALDHGAAHVLLVEKSPAALRVLRENARSCGPAARVQQRDAVAAVRSLAGRQFDIIFLDPPYGKGEVPRSLEALGLACILAPQGVVVAEHHHKDLVPEACGALHRFRREKYGETVLSFYQVEAVDPSDTLQQEAP